MEMSEIYNGSQWAHDIFLVNKAGAMEYYHGPILQHVMLHIIKKHSSQSKYITGQKK